MHRHKSCYGQGFYDDRAGTQTSGGSLVLSRFSSMNAFKAYLQENGRALCIHLPQRSWYATYHEKVATPITMDDILGRITDLRYNSSDELMADFTTMFQNAYDCYPAGSDIVSAATSLKLVAEDAATRVTNGTVLEMPYTIVREECNISDNDDDDPAYTPKAVSPRA